MDRVGVFKLLKCINETKVSGPDEILGKILKLCAEELHEVLTIIFQKSLDSGTLSNDWKTVHIVPLLKKIR